MEIGQIIVNLKEWFFTDGINYSLKLVYAIAIFITGRIIAGLVRKLIKSLMNKNKMDLTLTSFVASVSYITMLTFVVISALGVLGIPTAQFVAILGAAGLAIGLALQGSLSNFAAGVLMIIFKPLKVGDYVEAGGASGSVEEVGIFTTIIKSPDNKKIIVPNSRITGDNITNYSANDIRRIDIVAGVSYGDDIDKVRKVLSAIQAEDERILKDPAPMIGLAELGDSSVNFTVRSWVKTSEYWDVFFDTQEKIKKRFDAEGISIPFPQQDVHIISGSQN
ncbi:MAG: mechanosensitive ion channel [Deltaproteobacteria bacterium]|nr:mechanosensitive ion channel [Deltaproteobacteria bacterium]